MNIWVKRAVAAAGIAAAITAPLSGLASDGTLTFTGAVTGSSCTISVNGGGADATIALPTVDTAALDNSAGKTEAGGTFFNIALSDCNAEDDFGGAEPTNVRIYFEAGENVDENTGGLINLAPSGSNVEVKLYNASQGTVVGTQITPGKSTVQAPLQAIGDDVTHWFFAVYSTQRNGAASAGAVSTSITYSVIYL